MPTVLSRTFALLSNTKSPQETNLNSRILQGSVTGSQHISIELEEPTEKPEMSIWKAAELGDLGVLQYYVDHNQGVELSTLLNTRDPETDNTLLHLAIAHGNPKRLWSMLKLLLENGADASACDVYNVQAIHMVSLHLPQQPLPSLELLLNHKANPNATDGDGWTPLHYAARFCQAPEPVMDLLISRGADINRRDAAHKTPLFALLANGDHAQILTKYDPDLSLLGDFLDPVTRRTRPGSLLVQACKYAREGCLALLVQSKTIQKVVSRQEIQWACEFVAENEKMMACLQALEATLEATSLDKKQHGSRLLKRVHRIMKRSRLDENK